MNSAALYGTYVNICVSQQAVFLQLQSQHLFHQQLIIKLNKLIIAENKDSALTTKREPNKGKVGIETHLYFDQFFNYDLVIFFFFPSCQSTFFFFLCCQFYSVSLVFDFNSLSPFWREEERFERRPGECLRAYKKTKLTVSPVSNALPAERINSTAVVACHATEENYNLKEISSNLSRIEYLHR